MATYSGGFSAPFDLVVTLGQRDRRRPWPLRDVYAFALQHRRVSARALHRRLRIPRVKGEKYLEVLEREGIVGPRSPGGSREVLVRE